MPKKTYVIRKRTRDRPVATQSGRRAAKRKQRAQSESSPVPASTELQGDRPRIVWSLIDFETCRPVVSDAGEVKLGESSHHAIEIEGCMGGVFQFKDSMGIVGTLVAFPGMHPEAFVQKFDRGDADEFTYIVKDGVKEFASVVKEEEEV